MGLLMLKLMVTGNGKNSHENDAKKKYKYVIALIFIQTWRKITNMKRNEYKKITLNVALVFQRCEKATESVFIFAVSVQAVVTATTTIVFLMNQL